MHTKETTPAASDKSQLKSFFCAYNENAQLMNAIFAIAQKTDCVIAYKSKYTTEELKKALLLIKQQAETALNPNS
jgi:hypothetical protein